MDILKRSISNITDLAWDEIDEQAAEVIRANLSARKIVDVSGPHGWDYAAYPFGRLKMAECSEKNNLCFGTHMVMPLTEVRISFELDTWELDNISRGSKDADLSGLEEAAKEIAVFEEETLYNGLETSCILGIAQAGKDNALEGSKDNLLELLSRGVRSMGKKAIGGPYALVADEDLWTYIYSKSAGYPLSKSVASIADGGIILSPSLKGSYLVSVRGGDMEMVLGQDYSVGFQSRNNNKVKLFITESFAFRVIEPDAIIPLNLK